MRSYQLLFVLLLLLCAVVAYAATLEEVPSQRGMTHPDFATMQLGGDSEARHGEILWLGYSFGALVIAFFVGLIDVALARGGKSGPASARRTVWLVGAGLEVVFLLLVLSYRAFMSDPSGDVWGFPRPTAWMMYGIWGFPMLFVVLYIFRFEQWILSPEDEAEFALLEKERDAQRVAPQGAEGGQE